MDLVVLVNKVLEVARLVDKVALRRSWQDLWYFISQEETKTQAQREGAESGCSGKELAYTWAEWPSVMKI